jgi:arsenate reductase
LEERDLIQQPLTQTEIKELAAKLGGIRELVAPKRREETAKLTDAQLLKHLAENPNHVRRPIIDTGKVIVAGFTAEVRAKLTE